MAAHVYQSAVQCCGCDVLTLRSLFGNRGHVPTHYYSMHNFEKYDPIQPSADDCCEKREQCIHQSFYDSSLHIFSLQILFLALHIDHQSIQQFLCSLFPLYLIQFSLNPLMNVPSVFLLALNVLQNYLQVEQNFLPSSSCKFFLTHQFDLGKFFLNLHK